MWVSRRSSTLNPALRFSPSCKTFQMFSQCLRLALFFESKMLQVQLSISTAHLSIMFPIFSWGLILKKQQKKLDTISVLQEKLIEIYKQTISLHLIETHMLLNYLVKFNAQMHNFSQTTSVINQAIADILRILLGR